MQKKIGFILLLAILATGIYARFVELEWHFTNVDDRGVAEIIFKNRQTGEHGRFPIPTFYTYAPLQFAITPWLISEEQDYRATIFWGRLPSCLFGILGLFFFIFFYRIYEKEHIAWIFLPLVLLACSWENIIHAKQMHNYALGVTACIGILMIIIHNLSLKKLSMTQTLINTLLFTLCSYAHYQILPLIPCAFLTLFLYFIKIDSKKVNLFFKFLMSGSIYLALIFPMWFFFLRRHLDLNAGAPLVSAGPHNEFIFTFSSNAGLLEKARSTLEYFGQNLFIVFQANTAFMPETHTLFTFVSMTLYALFLFGILSFFFKKSPKGKYLGLFLALVGASWVYLICTNKLNLSPTRHTLILLPFFCLLVGEGLKQLLDWAKGEKKRNLLEFYTPLIASVLVLGLFFGQYGVFLKERHDPFIESKILNLLKEYKVDHIFSSGRTDSLPMMPRVQAYVNNLSPAEKEAFASVAWISREDKPRTLQECEKMRNLYNLQQVELMKRSRRKQPIATHPCHEYELVYQDARPTSLQIDFSRRTQVNLYTNSYYFYVFQLKKRP